MYNESWLLLSLSSVVFFKFTTSLWFLGSFTMISATEISSPTPSLVICLYTLPGFSPSLPNFLIASLVLLLVVTYFVDMSWNERIPLFLRSRKYEWKNDTTADIITDSQSVSAWHRKACSTRIMISQIIDFTNKEKTYFVFSEWFQVRLCFLTISQIFVKYFKYICEIRLWIILPHILLLLFFEIIIIIIYYYYFNNNNNNILLLFFENNNNILLLLIFFFGFVIYNSKTWISLLLILIK